MSFCRVVLFKYILLGLFLSSACDAAIMTAGIETSSLKTYSIENKRCHFQLQARRDGRAVQSGLDQFPVFADKSGRRGAGLTFFFQCTTTDDPNYCVNGWRDNLKGENPDLVKNMDVVNFGHFHSIYESLAYDSSATVMNSPRSRSIQFCLNDGMSVLEGYVSVGVEGRERPQSALRILRTIRFTDRAQ